MLTQEGDVGGGNIFQDLGCLLKLAVTDLNRFVSSFSNALWLFKEDSIVSYASQLEEMFLNVTDAKTNAFLPSINRVDEILTALSRQTGRFAMDWMSYLCR